MRKLIGNSIRAVLKGADVEIEGILIDSDNEFDYIQYDNATVRVVPKANILYYETNYIAQDTRLIESKVEDVAKVPSPELEELAIFVDNALLCEIKIEAGVKPNDLPEVLYSHERIKSYLHGKVLKKIEKFQDKVYITTAITQPESEVSFSMGSGADPVSKFLNPSDMVARLTKGGKNGQDM